MMKIVAHILVVILLSITSSLVYAYDPSPLQDICVADLNSKGTLYLQYIFLSWLKMFVQNSILLLGYSITVTI